MNPLLKRMMQRVMAKETGGEGGGGGGGMDDMDLGSGDIDYDDVSGDRGDTFEALEDGGEEKEEPEEEEEKEEPEEEEEEEEKEDPAVKKVKDKKENRMVPRERLNEEARKRKEDRIKLEAENNRLREQLSRDESSKQHAAIESEIEVLDDEYSKLSADGQTDKAADVLKQIRLKERELLRLESSTMTERARSAAKEEIKVETLVETLVEQHPSIDPDSDEYDQDVVDMIEGLRARYMSAGQTPSAALKAAANTVLGRVAVQASEPEPKKGLTGAAKAGDRTAAAVKKAVDASARQPAKAEVGVDHDKRGPAYTPAKIAKMSDEEYEKLPEHVRAKARGDFV